MKSRIAYCISVFIMIAFIYHTPRWSRYGSESTFGWDVSGYYWYLPSLFIYHDLKKQHFADSIINQYQFTPSFIQAQPVTNGNYVCTYSAGMAVMYSPFFFAAHLIAPATGYPADGFSKPYMMAISFGSLLVAFIGLWCFRRLLLYYYSDTTTAIMLLTLVIGTNYLNYATIDGALSHNWIFTIYVLLLISTQAYYRTLKTRYAVFIGSLCGLAILTRPSEIVAICIPVFWGIKSLSFNAIRSRMLFLRNNIKSVLLAVLSVIAVGSVQLIYWKYTSGQWLVYSYGKQGFSWLHPHFKDYMFSYRSGWLIYTPMLLCSFIGIIPFIKYGRNKLAVLSFFLLNLYIVSAWDIWWYAGTGGRAMIQSYPVILLPLASLIEYAQSKIIKWILYPAMLLFAYVNIWMTIQQHGGTGLYDSEGMTRAYYWKVMGRWNMDKEVMKLKDTDELFEGTPAFTQTVYHNDFENDTAGIYPNAAINGKRSIYVDQSHTNSPVYTFDYYKNDANWLRAQATFCTEHTEWTNWKMTQFIVSFTNHQKEVKNRMIRVQRFLEDSSIRQLSIDVKLPTEPVDQVHVSFWNPGSDYLILIDDLDIKTFK